MPRKRQKSVLGEVLDTILDDAPEPSTDLLEEALAALGIDYSDVAAYAVKEGDCVVIVTKSENRKHRYVRPKP
jgi:hypothetical protein